MRQIDEVTTAIASAVEEQGAATREISQNVQMAASGTQTLASSISTVNTAIGETNRSADQVLDASGKVSTAAATLDRTGAGVLHHAAQRPDGPPRAGRSELPRTGAAQRQRAGSQGCVRAGLADGEARAFFVKLRSGALDRRKQDDPDTGDRSGGSTPIAARKPLEPNARRPVRDGAVG